MMAPNYWDPLSNTLSRPLRLPPFGSVIVTIAQPSHHPSSLALRVHGATSISPLHQHALLAQVSRMLRLSETEEKAVREFRKICIYGDDDDQNRSFNGRVFRSPALFEDMVKCILLCNCQWSRTLSMAKALCELQLELQNISSFPSVVGGGATISSDQKEKVEIENYIPKTPATKETKKKHSTPSFSSKGKFLKKKLEFEVDGNFHEDRVLATSLNSNLPQTDTDGNYKSCENSKQFSAHDESFIGFSNGRDYFANGGIGNFPSPEELANLDESFLANRCKLGYRAGRIVKLARAIVEGRIQLGLLEELSKDERLLSYEQLTEHLKEIEGFGPFTRANVLMCMGYYHVVPTDSETIRHLKQVHSRKSTTRTVQRDIEEIYGKYEPYQYLAYWSELWDFYERRFGKMNEMSCSDYKLITATNMRSDGSRKRKRKRSP